MGQRPFIAVVDGQGGGIGKAIVERLKKELPTVRVRALGTNTAATERMLRSGADEGATGENAIICGVRQATVVIGVLAIISPNALLGELTPKMAGAIGGSAAVKILIPMDRCALRVAVPAEFTLPQYIDRAVALAKEALEEVN